MNSQEITIENLSFSYGEREIFRNLNLNLPGGFVSIIGPNGSGKSTLFKLLTGLEKPEAGSIHISHKEVGKMEPLEKAKLFTAIHQNQEFSFPFTCTELVALGRYPYRKGFGGLSEEDYGFILSAMKDTDTLKYKDKLVTELSGGEKQRVHIGAALAQDTPVIFLDEAFSALDISHKAYMIRLMKRKIEEENKMVVAVMHDLNMAYRYSDTVCMMKDGQVIACDKPELAMTESKIREVFDIDVDLIEGRGFFVNL